MWLIKKPSRTIDYWHATLLFSFRYRNGTHTNDTHGRYINNSSLPIKSFISPQSQRQKKSPYLPPRTLPCPRSKPTQPHSSPSRLGHPPSSKRTSLSKQHYDHHPLSSSNPQYTGSTNPDPVCCMSELESAPNGPGMEMRARVLKGRIYRLVLWNVSCSVSQVLGLQFEEW